MIGEWQLQHVLEVAGQNDVPAAVASRPDRAVPAVTGPGLAVRNRSNAGRSRAVPLAWRSRSCSTSVQACTDVLHERDRQASGTALLRPALLLLRTASPGPVTAGTARSGRLATAAGTSF